MRRNWKNRLNDFELSGRVGELSIWLGRKREKLERLKRDMVKTEEEIKEMEEVLQQVIKENKERAEEMLRGAGEIALRNQR